VTYEQAKEFARFLETQPISVQLPDNEPPLGMTFMAFDEGDSDSHVVCFPTPPDWAGRGAVWDTEHNINDWISDPHAQKEDQ
jgi:hypothetical protein